MNVSHPILHSKTFKILTIIDITRAVTKLHLTSYYWAKMHLKLRRKKPNQLLALKLVQNMMIFLGSVTFIRKRMVIKYLLGLSPLYLVMNKLTIWSSRVIKRRTITKRTLIRSLIGIKNNRLETGLRYQSSRTSL